MKHTPFPSANHRQSGLKAHLELRWDICTEENILLGPGLGVQERAELETSNRSTDRVESGSEETIQRLPANLLSCYY